MTVQHIDRVGRLLIEGFEGLRLRAYPDPVTHGAPWTIGYGHATAGGPPTVVPGMEITQQEADEILSRDVVRFEAAVLGSVGKFQLNQAQLNGCTSLAYNIGPSGFRHSVVAERLRTGDVHGAAAAFMLYVRAGGKFNQGLANRRHAEVAAFNGHGEPVVRHLVEAHRTMGAGMVVPDRATA